MQKLFFLHFMKSGGTTLHCQFLALLGEGALCPTRNSFHAPLTSEDYETYSFISGHFSLAEALRAKTHYGYKLVLVLRDPIDRIVSQYNFFNAHDLGKHAEFLRGDHPQHRTLQAVQQTAVEVFFDAQDTINYLVFNNYYANVLTSPRAQYLGAVVPKLKKKEFDNSPWMAILSQFDHVTTLRNGLELINAVRTEYAAPPLDALTPTKITKDEMQWHEWMRPVELLTRHTLPANAGRLIQYDLEVYQTIDSI